MYAAHVLACELGHHAARHPQHAFLFECHATDETRVIFLDSKNTTYFHYTYQSPRLMQTESLCAVQSSDTPSVRCLDHEHAMHPSALRISVRQGRLGDIWCKSFHDRITASPNIGRCVPNRTRTAYLVVMSYRSTNSPTSTTPLALAYTGPIRHAAWIRRRVQTW